MQGDKDRLTELLIQLWNTGSADAANEIYATNAERYDPMNTEPSRGPEGNTAYTSAVRSGFPDFTLTVQDTVIEENRRVSRWTCTATHEGNFQGLAPTGKRVKIEGLTWARTENGKIVEERVYFDRLGFYEQLGVATPVSQVSQGASAR